ncbi:MAG TPA: pyridoxal phosphate-dependent aminotransferase [Chthoniobacterales bacterium]|jgi:aspartate/methionine/tyrosine aminotransferase
MANLRSEARSAYMEWAKLCSASRHNLATSGMLSLSLVDLPVRIEQLEVNGPGGYGYRPLLEAISRRYRVPQESIISAIGTSMANYLALAATTEPGDQVLIERPGYEPLVSTARYLGVDVAYFERRAGEQFAIDVAELERQITPRTRLIAITNLHNPSGAFCPDDTLREIAKVARRSGIHVLVDEVYLEMLFESEPQTAFHIDPETFLITNSLTKAYGLSGLRCGWVLAPPEVAHRMRRINDLHGVTFVHPGELLGVVAFERLGEISVRMKDVLVENRELLRCFLNSRDDLDSFWPEYGTIAFPRLRRGDVDQLCEFLRASSDTSVVPGRFFDAPGHFRIGVGGSTDSVRDALTKLGNGLDRFAVENAKSAVAHVS